MCASAIEAATGAPAFYARGQREARTRRSGPGCERRSHPGPSIRPDRGRGPDANYSSLTFRIVTLPTGTGFPSRTNIGARLSEVATNGSAAIFGAW